MEAINDPTTPKLRWTPCLQSGPQRMSHAAAAVGEMIYSFGGYSSEEKLRVLRPMDIMVFDLESHTWKTQEPPRRPQDTPTRLYGHTAVAYMGQIYVWGGRDLLNKPSNELYRYTPDSNTWDCPLVTGQIPRARSGHSACLVKECMYIISGYGDDDEIINDMSSLNLDTMEWVLLSPKLELLPQEDFAKRKEFHTAVATGDVMFVFGGKLNIQEAYFNKAIGFETRANNWFRMTPPPLDAPFARHGHSLFTLNGNIYLFGGHNRQIDKYFGDLHVLDLKNKKWTQLGSEGHQPSPRHSHCACLVENKVVVFGGAVPVRNTGGNAKGKPFTDAQQTFILELDLRSPVETPGSSWMNRPNVKAVLKMGYTSRQIERALQSLRIEHGPGRENASPEEIVEVLSKRATSAARRQVAPQQDLHRLQRENTELKEQRKCKICIDKDACMTFVPCGHFACCESCSSNMPTCPICREIIQLKIRTYMS